MDDLFFDKKNEFTTYLSTATKFSEQGKEGTTYRKGNLVIKDFGAKPVFDTEHVLQFRDLKLKDFYFPQAGIYVRSKLRACITKYAPGLSLNERAIFAVDIDTVLNAIERLEGAIRKASKNKVRIKDIHGDNVLFDRDHFNFIDTLPYYFSPLEYEEILKLNIEHVMRNIYMRILPSRLYHYQMKCNGKDTMYHFPHECLEELVALLEKLLGQFQSFSEAEDMINRQKIILPLK